MNGNKTCGTCVHVCETLLHCTYAETDTRYYGRMTSPSATACEHYMERANHIEQRCQGLEQLAREMLEKLRWYGDGEFCCVYQSDIDPFAKRLRELGVNLDD